MGLINQLITSYNLGEYHLPGVISLHRSDRIIEVAPTAAPEPQEGRKKIQVFSMDHWKPLAASGRISMNFCELMGMRFYKSYDASRKGRNP